MFDLGSLLQLYNFPHQRHGFFLILGHKELQHRKSRTPVCLALESDHSFQLLILTLGRHKVQSRVLAYFVLKFHESPLLFQMNTMVDDILLESLLHLL